MKLEKLVGERFKERPADCVIDSHAIMEKIRDAVKKENNIIGTFYRNCGVHYREAESAEYETSDRKSTRLNSSHMPKSRMPSSA